MRLTTSPLSCAEYHEIWEPKSPETLWATPDLLRDSFTFTLILHNYVFEFPNNRKDCEDGSSKTTYYTTRRVWR